MAFGDWVGLIATTLVILGVMGSFLIWLIKNVVRDEIAKATRSIQPGYYNGGESLGDISKKVSRIMDHIGLEE